MNSPVLLGGIDAFHLMHDRDMRARGLAGNHCAFVVELEGRLDPARLTERLSRAAWLVPELCFRLEGRLAQLPRWVVDPGRSLPPVRLIDAPDEGGLLHAAEMLLAERLCGQSPWALDVVRLPHHDAIVFRWFHPLADAKASERLVAWLGSAGEGGPEDPPAPDERFASSDRALDKLDRDAQLELLRAYGNAMIALSSPPILSLATAAEAAAQSHGPRAMRVLRVWLSPEETRRFDKRVREIAKLAESAVMVLAAARIADRALRRRDLAPPRYLIPVPLSLDPKVGCSRLFGNHLTMMMFSLDRAHLRNEAQAIAHLLAQQRTIVKEKLDLGMIAALKYARRIPRIPYRWILTRPFHGEMGSLIFSNPGAVSLTSFAGLKVSDAYPLPAVVSPPGFQVIFTRFAGRLSALLVYVDGVLFGAEAQQVAEELRRELLGEAAPIG
jgi:diacylglycerol O-acyltransferase